MDTLFGLDEFEEEGGLNLSKDQRTSAALLRCLILVSASLKS